MPRSRQSLAAPPLPPAVYLILLALRDGPAHGYRLRQLIVDHSDGALRLDPGSLYRLVGRLVDEGLIAESQQALSDERRRYYRLTTSGQRVLQAETDRMAALVARARGVKKPRHA